MFGFLNVDKPAGVTSHDVISRLRKVTGIKKIGHAGTLDPCATGVLPIAVGKATRLLDFLPTEKEYEALFRLGYVSKSYDCETELEHFSDKRPDATTVRTVLDSFKGEIFQKPPIYSAVKINGKKLYESAREGEHVEIPVRKIFVENVELTAFDGDTGVLKIKCSKGTYIRSIIHDAGQMLGCGAVMTGLRRTLSGGMLIKNAVPLEFFSSREVAEQNLISPVEPIKTELIELTPEMLKKVKNGNFVNVNSIDGKYFAVSNGSFIAFGEVLDGILKPRIVFCE